MGEICAQCSPKLIQDGSIYAQDRQMQHNNDIVERAADKDPGISWYSNSIV